jgi:serine/threonine-protein kinase
MAPEQARGERVDASADTFAVGVMLWEALTSRRLRNTQNDYELLRSLTMEELPRASSVNPAVNPLLDRICAKALSVRREDRYTTAAECRLELERAIDQAGLVASHRELGATVAGMFADERAATNVLIEAHVAQARSAGDRVQVPIIHAGASSALGMTPSGEAQWPAWDAGSSPVQQPTVRSQLPSLPSLSPPPSLAPVVTQVRTRSSLVIPAVTIAVLGAAALVYVVFFLPQRLPAVPSVAALPQAPAPVTPAQTVEPAAPSPPVAVPVAAPVVEELVEVEIRVTPPEATVTIDGALVSGNPFRGKFPRGEAMRQVRAEAPGFLPKSRALAFSSDIKMDLALERRVRAASAPARPTRVSAPAPRPPEPAKPVEPPPAHVPEINPAGGTKPSRPIDSSNPYGN